MAEQEDSSFQPVMNCFEDDVLTLAYYIKDRDVICGEYKSAEIWLNHNLKGCLMHIQGAPIG